jgi:hypothetical protein
MGTGKNYTWRDALIVWFRGIKQTFRLALGRIHYELERARIESDARRPFIANKQAGALTDEQVSEIASHQTAKVGKTALARSKIAITDETIKKPVANQQKGAALLLRVLQEHRDIKSVANIGARVDVVSSYLAGRFPSVTFTSVDFQPDLRSHNCHLPKHPNWNFKSGYALRLIEKGEIRPDTVFMTSTSVLFNNRELDAYFKVFHDAGVRYVILNEPWWQNVKTIGRIVMPENVPVDDPYCAGAHGNYHHNYPAKLARAGYEVLSSELIPAYDRGCLLLQIVARQI